MRDLHVRSWFPSSPLPIEKSSRPLSSPICGRIACGYCLIPCCYPFHDGHVPLLSPFRSHHSIALRFTYPLVTQGHALPVYEKYDLLLLVLYFPLCGVPTIMLSRSSSTGSTRPLSGQASRSSSPSSNLPPSGLLFQSRFVTSPGTDYYEQYRLPTDFKTRPGYNTTGREVSVKLNSFPVVQLPLNPVYQYDVQIGNGAEKRAVILKAWATKARKAATGEWFIFDGNKLGWSGQNFDRDIHVTADLDADEGRSSGRTSNTFRIVIRKAKTLNLSLIQAYFNRQIQMGPEILEGISKCFAFPHRIMDI